MTSVKAKAIETELVIPGNNTRFTYLDISINLFISGQIYQYHNYFFGSECSEKGKSTHIQTFSKRFPFQRKKTYNINYYIINMNTENNHCIYICI